MHYIKIFYGKFFKSLWPSSPENFHLIILNIILQDNLKLILQDNVATRPKAYLTTLFKINSPRYLFNISSPGYLFKYNSTGYCCHKAKGLFKI